jgi:hypothetical protein
MNSKNDISATSKSKGVVDGKSRLDRNRVDPTPNSIPIPDGDDKSSPCLPDPPNKMIQNSKISLRKSARRASESFEKSNFAMPKIFDHSKKLFSDEYDEYHISQKPAETDSDSKHKETDLLYKINNNLEVKNKLLESEIRKLSKQNEERDKSNALRLNESKHKVDGLNNQINYLMEQNEELNKLVRGFQNDLTSIRHDRKENETKSHENEALAEKNQSLKLQEHLNFFTQKLLEKDKIIDLLNDKLNEKVKLDMQGSAPQRENESKNKVIKDLENENTNLKHQLSHYYDLKNDKVKANVLGSEETSEQFRSLKNENSVLSARIKLLEAEISNIRKASGQGSEQGGDIFTKWLEIFRLKEDEIVLYKNELSKLINENEALSSQLNKKSSKDIPVKLIDAKDTPSKRNIFFNTYSEQKLDHKESPVEDVSSRSKRNSSRSSIDYGRSNNETRGENKFGSFSSKQEAFQTKTPTDFNEKRSINFSLSRENFQASTSPRSVRQVSYTPTKVFYNGTEIRNGLSLLKSDFNTYASQSSRNVIPPTQGTTNDYYQETSKYLLRVSKVDVDPNPQRSRYLEGNTRSERSVKKYIISSTSDPSKFSHRSPEPKRDQYNEYSDSSKITDRGLKEYSSRKYTTHNISLDDKENTPRSPYGGLPQNRQNYTQY